MQVQSEQYAHKKTIHLVTTRHPPSTQVAQYRHLFLWTYVTKILSLKATAANQYFNSTQHY
ncbi:hypothetical protein Lepto7375DRAFT_3325 [Leptolyngbya sp. PCC 7375]|nr:hypothetical protein Lepto7375DRAFT_3325 [Leptolyngbya sp. PCC 7375]